MTMTIDLGASVLGGGSRFDGPLDRLLYLRLESQLSSLSAHELSLLAQHSEERFFKAGSELMTEGTPAPAVHFIVEGHVTMRRGEVTYRDMRAPAVVGFPAVLSQDPRGVRVVAEEDSITLEVSANVMLDLIEDNFPFMTGALGGLSGQMIDAQQALELKGLLNRSEPEDSPYPEAPLDIVQRLSQLRRGVYTKVNLEALMDLVRGAEEIRLQPGDTLWEEGASSDFSIHVVHGVVLCESPDSGIHFRMGPGSVIGPLEANAGRAHSYRAVCETRLVAIRSPTDMFFDVLEDHPQLGMGVLSFLASTLVDLQTRVARSNTQVDDPAT